MKQHSKVMSLCVSHLKTEYKLDLVLLYPDWFLEHPEEQLWGSDSAPEQEQNKESEQMTNDSHVRIEVSLHILPHLSSKV